jgi:protein TonB
MRRPRHRVKSNLLWKMLGLAALANVLLWPILIRLGAFHGVRQELFPVTLVVAARPAAPKAPSALPKAPKPVPVVSAAPPVPAPKPKPILVATTPPVVKTAQRSSRRHRSAQPRRLTRGALTAKATAAHTIAKHPTPKIAAVRVPAKPVVAKSKPVKAANSKMSSVPPTTPMTNTVPPSEGSPPALRPAVALVKVQPAIPDSMQNSAWHALFRGQFAVDKNGHVTPRMISSTGRSVLDARALEAARHWKFQPATRNGVPVASTVKFEIEYAVRSVP